jgi:hypothetical protein
MVALPAPLAYTLLCIFLACYAAQQGTKRVAAAAIALQPQPGLPQGEAERT